MKKLLLIITFCSLSFGVIAQNTVKETKIRNLLKITKTDELAIQSMDQMISMFKSSNADVNTKFWDDFKKEVDVNSLIDLIVPIYDKYYSETEIEELTAFYNSPIGKKTIDTLPKLTQESMVAGQQWGMEMGQKIQAKLKETSNKNE
jgi:hypothetical protein